MTACLQARHTATLVWALQCCLMFIVGLGASCQLCLTAGQLENSVSLGVKHLDEKGLPRLEKVLQTYPTCRRSAG